jgi:hypothetical protein
MKSRPGENRLDSTKSAGEPELAWGFTCLFRNSSGLCRIDSPVIYIRLNKRAKSKIYAFVIGL